jgi:hypothetical protein
MNRDCGPLLATLQSADVPEGEWDRITGAEAGQILGPYRRHDGHSIYMVLGRTPREQSRPAEPPAGRLEWLWGGVA